MISEYFVDHSKILEFAGVVGFGLYVSNYLMLTFRVLTGNCVLYYCVNVAAASLVLTSLMNSFNLASVLIQVFWICISSVGIAIRLRPDKFRMGR